MHYSSERTGPRRHSGILNSQKKCFYFVTFQEDVLSCLTFQRVCFVILFENVQRPLMDSLFDIKHNR